MDFCELAFGLGIVCGLMIAVFLHVCVMPLHLEDFRTSPE